jgi:hypothetical protein
MRRRCGEGTSDLAFEKFLTKLMRNREALVKKYDESDKERALKLLLDNGFQLVNESAEVLQFSGLGYVDLLIARRPISKEILKLSNVGGPEGINFVRAEDLIGLKIQAYKNDKSREFQDKADIQFLISTLNDLDWDLIKKYADLFAEWEVISEIKKNFKP